MDTRPDGGATGGRQTSIPPVVVAKRRARTPEGYSARSLSAIRAAAARHHFQTLDFLAHGFVKYGVGKEDQPVRAGVGVVLTGFPWTECARLCGVHSL